MLQFKVAQNLSSEYVYITLMGSIQHTYYQSFSKIYVIKYYILGYIFPNFQQVLYLYICNKFIFVYILQIYIYAYMFLCVLSQLVVTGKKCSIMDSRPITNMDTSSLPTCIVGNCVTDLAKMRVPSVRMPKVKVNIEDILQWHIFVNFQNIFTYLYNTCHLLS